jgi:urease accessory protein
MTNINGSFHALLLLSDSALPLGSFAFSSGLESFLAHHKFNNAAAKVAGLDAFLEHSIANVASTALPYVFAAYKDPSRLDDLDNAFEASTPCTVARRASVAQGKALLTIWEKALSSSTASNEQCQAAATHITAFATAIKSSKPDAFGLQLNAHFPPLFGTACLALGLGCEETAYLFLLNHAKALLSAAVRASVVGPYQSQAILASGKLQGWIRASTKRNGAKNVGDACVTVPTMDLWMGRHELLYSRIFNS